MKKYLDRIVDFYKTHVRPKKGIYRKNIQNLEKITSLQ